VASTVVTSNREPIKAHRFGGTCARQCLTHTSSVTCGQGAARRRRCRLGS
jgi:hypothetical protein